MTERWETLRRQVAVAGRVIDTRTGKPLPGALVTITGASPAFKKKLAAKAMQYAAQWAGMVERADRTRSRKDGSFYFLDLPDGEYKLQASLPNMGKRYGAAEEKATVSRDDTGTIKLVFVDLPLQPTMLEGKVTGAGQKAGVVMAEVRVKGSGERTFSDAKGNYMLVAVEPGERTVLAIAQGYRPAQQKVALKMPGAAEKVNFALTRVNP
ncbi:MAG: carboxypeptidase-like regulatory domain-containing protein [Acidobacteriia bacterium]|nr:carboxypeptidase-like regulatory domain-containing protein [Terriglobia bacterium]